MQVLKYKFCHEAHTSCEAISMLEFLTKGSCWFMYFFSIPGRVYCLHVPSLKTNDYCAIPQQLKDQLCERYPGARRAYLKSGGDFPFLSRPDEVNLHLQVMILCLLMQDCVFHFALSMRCIEWKTCILMFAML